MSNEWYFTFIVHHFCLIYELNQSVLKRECESECQKKQNMGTSEYKILNC